MSMMHNLPLIMSCMICPMGGFPSIPHIEICDITTSLLTEVCHYVAIEHSIQLLCGESIYEFQLSKQ